jgi:hypothetical protein
MSRGLKVPVGRDIFERVASTFVYGVLTAYIASGVDIAHVLNLNLWKAAGVGGVMAVLSLIKNVLGQIISCGGGSLDPAVKVEPVPADDQA